MEKSTNKSKIVIILIITNLFMLFWFLCSLYLSYILLLNETKEPFAYNYFFSILHIVTVIFSWIIINYFIFLGNKLIMSITEFQKITNNRSEELNKLLNKD